MPRARRPWSQLRPEIYELLREPATPDGDAYWSHAAILQYFNHCMDLRSMQLGEQHEGWITEPFSTDLVAGQSEYTMPEGSGRIKRVLIVFNQGGLKSSIPLIRAERWSEPLFEAGSTATTVGGSVPTYRVMKNLIFLEPAPSENRADALKIELEAAPDRIVADVDKLDPLWPDIAETMLQYDTAVLALSVEGSQGNEAQIASLKNLRDEYAAMFFEYTAVRTFGRIFSSPYYLGD